MKRAHLLAAPTNPWRNVLAFALASVPALASAQEAPPPMPVPTAEAPAPPPPPAQPPPAPPPPAVVAPGRPAPITLSPRPSPEVFEAPEPRVEGPPRYHDLRVSLGPRIAYVRDSGFDLFADSDKLASLAIDASATLLRRGNLTFAAGLAWDVGGRSNGLRGFESRITVHRFTAPLEGRWHARPWIYGFAKLAPGVAHTRSEIADRDSPSLHGYTWAFATDLSAGVSVLVFPHANMDRRAVRFWVTPEIGYALVADANLRPVPNRDEDDVLGGDAKTNLGSIGLSGLFWRVSAAATF